MERKVVELRDVEKVYQMGSVSVEALRGVSLSISRGEFVVVMGPSGSGKTTLLNIIGTLDRPTKGRIYIDGQDLTAMDEEQLTDLRRHKIGFVFQFYNLIPVLSALENVELPLLISGVDKTSRVGRSASLLGLVGLKERIHHRPDELSGGEQQRVAIARALANRPSLILADEPTGDLDSATGLEVVKVLHSSAKEENVAVLVVTHDETISSRADRIIWMRDGSIVKDTMRGGPQFPSQD